MLTRNYQHNQQALYSIIPVIWSATFSNSADAAMCFKTILQPNT